MNNPLVAMSIYRHFKGGYYIVQAFGIYEPTGESVVIYQSLQNSQIWVRPVSVFQELVPEDKENPTGQKYRFERVTDFNNQISMISTEGLLKELLSRNDCPVELQTSIDNDKIWREQYLTGRYTQHFIDIEHTLEDFDIDTVHNTFDEAVRRVKNTNNPFMQILKQVFIKQDFDDSPDM